MNPEELRRQAQGGAAVVDAALLREAAGARARRGVQGLGLRGERVPGLLRRDRHRHKRPRGAGDNRGHKGAGGQDPAHLDALPDREPGQAGREADRARPDLGREEGVLRGERLRGERGGAALRHVLPELQRDHRAALLLPRQHLHDDGHNGPEHLEPDLALGPRRGLRPQPLPAPLRPVPQRGQVQPPVRRRRAGGHRGGDHGQRRGVYRRAHPGRRGLRRGAARLLRAGKGASWTRRAYS